MQNGDNGRSVSVTVKDWFEYDGSIRLAVPDFPPAFIRVSDDPERPSGHPKLFKILARYLREQGGTRTSDLDVRHKTVAERAQNLRTLESATQ